MGGGGGRGGAHVKGRCSTASDTLVVVRTLCVRTYVHRVGRTVRSSTNPTQSPPLPHPAPAWGSSLCRPYIMDLKSTNGTFLNGERVGVAPARLSLRARAYVLCVLLCVFVLSCFDVFVWAYSCVLKRNAS
jgi:hypothetical protein